MELHGAMYKYLLYFMNKPVLGSIQIISGEQSEI